MDRKTDRLAYRLNGRPKVESLMNIIIIDIVCLTWYLWCNFCSCGLNQRPGPGPDWPIVSRQAQSKQRQDQQTWQPPVNDFDINCIYRYLILSLVAFSCHSGPDTQCRPSHAWAQVLYVYNVVWHIRSLINWLIDQSKPICLCLPSGNITRMYKK